MIAVDLQEECTELEHLTLVMASDGLWDLYEIEEVFDGIVEPRAEGQVQSTERANAFFERSLMQGDDIFGEHTDNITQVVIYFNPASPREQSCASKVAADKWGPLQASCFSI